MEDENKNRFGIHMAQLCSSTGRSGVYGSTQGRRPRVTGGLLSLLVITDNASPLSFSLLSPPKGLTLREMEVQLAMEAEEARWIFLLGETVNADNVLLPGVAVGGVGEADLVVEVVDQSQRLQVAVELIHLGQRYLGQGLDHIAHGDVVREAHPIPHLREPALACQHPHLLRQRLAQAEAGTTGGKPEGDPLLQERSLR